MIKMSDVELGDALIQVASMLDVHVQYIYEVFVKAQLYNGIMDLIIIMVCAGLFVAGMVWRYKQGGSCDLEDWFPFILVLLMGIFIVVLILLVVKNCILMMICPEYMALKEILSLIGG